MHNAIKMIADYYGPSNQMDQTIEECAELIQAINKYKRNTDVSTKENILEEMADVEIMLEQMKWLLAGVGHTYVDIDFKILKIKNEKVIRQLKRMESELNAVETKTEEV